MEAAIGKNLKLALIGRSVSLLGNGFQAITLPLMLLERSGSLAISGTFFALNQLPAMLLTPWLGTIIEHLNKKRCMVICDFIQAALHLLLFFLFINDAPLWILGILFAFSGVIASIFSISTSVLLSELSNENNRERMNGLKGMADNLVALVAPFLGTLIYTFAGFSLILILNALSYGISGGMECLIENNSTFLHQPHEKQDFHELFVFFKKKPFLLRLILLTGILNLLAAPTEEIFYPGVLIEQCHFSEMMVGIVSFCFTAGVLLISAWFYRTGKTLFDLKKNLYMNHLLLGLLGILSLFVSIQSIYGILFSIGMLISGCLTTLINIPLLSLFQNEVDLQIQSRFFALQSFCSSWLIPMGIFFAGQLSEQIGSGITMTIFNLLLVLLVCILLKGYNKKEGKESR